MGIFTPKTYTDFVERMTGRIVARTELSDTEIGGVVSTIVNAVAREFDDLHYQMTNLQLLWDLDTASGEDLDARAKDVNPVEITRLLKTSSTGTVAFYRTTSGTAVTIPAGTAVKTSDGTEYTTNALSTIGSADTSVIGVAATAIVAGLSGNLSDIGLRKSDVGGPTGISLLSGTVAGVEEVNNDIPFTGGQDQENDSQLRERIKTYLRSLSRGTPDSLKSAVLGTTLTGYGRVVSAEVVEQAEPNLGEVTVYVDDGNGTIEFSEAVAEEIITASATGGEKRLWLLNPPVVDGSAVQITRWPSGGGAGALLVEDSSGADGFTLNRPTGKITLVTPLLAGAALKARNLLLPSTLSPGYTHYVGLIQEAQKIIDGDRLNRSAYPGYRAAGINVKVLSPVVYYQSVYATVVIESGFDQTTVTTAVKSALVSYINGLPINGDVIASELYYEAQTVSGVVDITFQDSAGLTISLVNTIIGEGEIARILSSAITVTGA
jgi:uncharacterized phage protein gp47/JayE